MPPARCTELVYIILYRRSRANLGVDMANMAKATWPRWPKRRGQGGQVDMANMANSTWPTGCLATWPPWPCRSPHPLLQLRVHRVEVLLSRQVRSGVADQNRQVF